MARSDWIAWVKSSVGKHFHTQVGGDIKIVLDTDDAPEGNILVLSTDVTIDDEGSNEAVIDVQVSAITKTLPSSTRRYYHEEIIGKIYDCFDIDIVVRKYNGGDGSIVGCLNRQEEISALPLITKEESVTTLSSSYELRLSEDF